MLPSRRHRMGDEELGKKDDDHKPRSDREHRWHSKTRWRPSRPRRWVIALIVLYLVYLFFKNMPTDLTPVRDRPAFTNPKQWSHPATSPAIPEQGPPPRDDNAPENNDDFYYDGEVKFYRLAASLKRFQKTGTRNGRPVNHAVLFAGASLGGVSDLLPLACQMARRKTNTVHFVLMGRDDVSIEGIQRVNGIDKEACPLNWHDARPDYAQWSTDARMERAVSTGLKYVYAYIRPSVIITQGESLEDSFLLRGPRGVSRDFEIPRITLPSASRDLMWMSTLDSSALQVWNDIRIEFLVNAQPRSSGSLIRLIQSLREADYLGSSPSLNIELPADADPQLLSYLKSLDWPVEKLTVRRHVQPHRLSSADASLKAVEAFYPKNPDTTHVLMLSPQIELAPSFYHFLKYTILKYKHSAHNKQSSSRLLGISLELPTTHITNDEAFDPPNSDAAHNSGKTSPPSFLWQAPNSNAALYFGDKWVEFHDFLSQRLSISDTGADSSSSEKIISKKYPAVMEYLLEMIRARGYYVLYPSFPASGTHTLATVHDELYHLPEEFSSDNAKSVDLPADPIEDPSKPLIPDTQELGTTESPLSRASTVMPLLDQFSLDLASMEDLPLLSYNGEEMTNAAFSRRTEEYMRLFRARYGGCGDHAMTDDSAVDLFCTDG